MFITYEEPYNGKVFSMEQMEKVYIELTDKNEYPNFECWLADMKKSGVFEEV